MIHPVLRAGKEIPSSIDEVATYNSSEISSELFPNPTSYEVSFRAYEDIVWSVYSLNGSQIMSGEAGQSMKVTIDTSDLHAGVYWVSMTNTNKSITSGKRLVILPH
jgi:photosystem II stability/assembly factor-like uncharacterized protein